MPAYRLAITYLLLGVLIGAGTNLAWQAITGDQTPPAWLMAVMALLVGATGYVLELARERRAIRRLAQYTAAHDLLEPRR